MCGWEYIKCPERTSKKVFQHAQNKDDETVV